MNHRAWARPTIARLMSWVRGSRPALAEPWREPLPDGVRVYAIGDIHGFPDLLDRIAVEIADDLVRNPPKEASAVFLGDYIDRGPDSAGVIERLAGKDFPVPFVVLRGNHEQMMLDALADADEMLGWCRSGGIETMRSYGVDAGKAGRKALAKAARALRDALPPHHRAFLDSTRLSFMLGDYFFVHAGARPGVALDKQAPDDLMWIRDAFFTSGYDFGKVIVHGHTPHPEPENAARRINVDTCAFKSGVLTAVALEGADRRFLDTRGAAPSRRDGLARHAPAKSRAGLDAR